MAKIKAVLDQETWVEVDVPDEFQAILTSLFCSEALISENLHDAQNNVETSYSEVITNNDCSLIVDAGPQKAQQQIEQANFIGESIENTANVKSTPLAEAIQKNKADAITNSAHSNNNKMKEHVKSTSQTLMYKDVGYHMVNWLVILFYLFLLFFKIFFLVCFERKSGLCVVDSLCWSFYGVHLYYELFALPYIF
jgi:vacuolar protein sorting-associated protein 54